MTKKKPNILDTCPDPYIRRTIRHCPIPVKELSKMHPKDLTVELLYLEFEEFCKKQWQKENR